MSFSVGPDGLRDIRWHGLELLRGVSAPIRDPDWAAFCANVVSTEIERHGNALAVVQQSVVGEGVAEAELRVVAHEEGRLSVLWSITPRADLTVNRAGLCLLHPLEGFEGVELIVIQPDGSETRTSFPESVTPSQPAKSIAGLRHVTKGVELSYGLSGETFEMEDQRNWSDASFKTYCRPLSAPRPYKLIAGATHTQELVVSFEGEPEVVSTSRELSLERTMPELLLAAEPGWLINEIPAGCAYLGRFDDRLWSDAELGALSLAPFDAEFIVPENSDPRQFLSAWAERLAKHGLVPRHVIALPEALLKSYQPEGPWPVGLTPEQCYDTATEVFPDASVGVGMLTNFTELNRRRPPLGDGAFITHGNAAIVHAADDASVLQTLEAIPAILDTATSFAGDRAYRLGLCAIGMRSNPYGKGLQSNSAGQRQTMTDYDPRQSTAFAAAYAIGLVALASRSNVQAICLGALGGPFSIAGPLRSAIEALNELSGRAVDIHRDQGRFAISGPGRTVSANCGADVWTSAPGGPLASANWRVSPTEAAVS